MRIRFAAASLAACLCLACPSNDVKPARKTATWITPSISFDLATPHAKPEISVPDCGEGSLRLVASTGGLRREVLLPFVEKEGVAIVTISRATVMTEPDACSLTHSNTITGSAFCADGSERPVEGELTATFEVATTALDTPAFAPAVARRFSRHAHDTRHWVSTRDGIEAVPVLPDTRQKITISGVHDSGVHQRVSSTLYTYVTAGCAGACPAVASSTGDGGSVLAAQEWIIAVPLEAAGTLTDFAHIAVPAGVVDISFDDGKLFVLSQANGHPILSTFAEAPGLPTVDTLNSVRVVLPYARASHFVPGPDNAPTIIAFTSLAADSWVAVPPESTDETVPLPYPSGGCGGGGGSSGGSIPQSNGNESGSSGSHPHASGCIGSLSAQAVVGVRRQESLDLRLTFGASSVVTTRPHAQISATLVDGISLLDRMVLAVDSAQDHASLFVYDTVGNTITWLKFPGESDETAEYLVQLALLSPSPDGEHFAVTTRTGFHVFDKSGAWVLGMEGLPEACLSAEAPTTTFVSSSQILVQLRSGPVVLTL